MFIKDSVYGQRLTTDAKSPISCFSPNLVYNPYIQDYVLVPCRECAACRYSYANFNSIKVQLEPVNP